MRSIEQMFQLYSFLRDIDLEPYVHIMKTHQEIELISQ